MLARGGRFDGYVKYLLTAVFLDFYSLFSVFKMLKPAR